MVRMLRKIPRPVFILNYYAYPILATMAVLFGAALFSTNGLSIPKLGIPVLILLMFSLVWWRFHARQSANLPTSADVVLRDLWRLQPYTLLAFESEYCPVSMTTAGQVLRLKNMKIEGLTIYSVSINKEPGRTWFQQFNGRVTPTYILLNSEGHTVMEWPLLLPVERIGYVVSNKLQVL